MAGAVADINREVAEGDSQDTLQALQAPGAGLRGVLPECSDAYQGQLAQKQNLNTTSGNSQSSMSNSNTNNTTTTPPSPPHNHHHNPNMLDNNILE